MQKIFWVSMDKLILNKEKLLEILAQENDDAAMESYYQQALSGHVVANEHMAMVAFLLLLVRYKRRKLFNDNMNPFHFFGVPQDDFKKYFELLERANWEIYESIKAKENIPDQPLVEFSEDCAILHFWRNNFFESLRACENALQRDENSFICNFIKASIIELCYINKTNIGYKIQLANYQKSLINKCDESQLNFNEQIYHKVMEIIDANYKTLDEQYHNINFTLAPETFEKTQEMIPEWTEEHDFCLRYRLFLNPLCNFDLFLESSFEELEDLQIEKEFKDTFDEIVEEFKMCRHLTFEFSKSSNDDTKRVQCMVYSYAYSILDKLAFLFSKVYEINVDEDEVAFTQNKLFDKKFKKEDLCFKKVKSPYIYPLYFIMEKVRGRQETKDAIKTVIFKFNELRNTIEHRTISKIEKNALQAHSIFLMKLIKEAILYSYMLLNSFSGKDGSHHNVSAISNSYYNAIIQIELEQRKKELSNDQL